MHRRIACFSLFPLLLACFASSAATLSISAVQKNGSPMPEVVVYLETADGSRMPAAAPSTAAVAQSGMQFVPYITVVKPGAKITFPNLDQVDHHVKSFSPAKEFELKISNGTLPAVSFDQPGIVALNCLLHDWMRGYILVLDSPFYAQLDATGKGDIENIPPGKYVVHAWQPDLGNFLPVLDQEVTVSANGAMAKFDFPFNARARRAPHAM